MSATFVGMPVFPVAARAALADTQLRHVLDSGAEICTSADNSCLMHIGGALKRQRTGVRTVHLAEILATTR